MATTNKREEDAASAAETTAATPAVKAARRSGGNVEATRLDSHNDAPSVTAPGDGPADTTDPSERATTVGGDKAAAARAGHLTVNAAVPVATDDNNQLRGVAISAALAERRDGGEERFEEYPATRPDGSVVTVRHNLDTGETSIS